MVDAVYGQCRQLFLAQLLRSGQVVVVVRDIPAVTAAHFQSAAPAAITQLEL
jgi:hypothetical protein